MRLKLEEIILPPPVPAGMNVLKLMSMAYRMRATNDDLEPIEVEWEAERNAWRLVDGRHRYVSCLIAGRGTILAMRKREHIRPDR